MTEPATTERHGVTVLEFQADGAKLSSDRDASDVISGAWENHATMVAIPVERFEGAFFDLSTRLAGEFTQKLVNYRIRLAIVGDISEYAAASSALSSYVYESNRGSQIWFVDSLSALDDRLRAHVAK
jgi:hypothetical protein